MRFQNIGDDAGEDGKERTTAVSSVGDCDGNANELTTAVSPIGDDDGEDVIKLRRRCQ